MDQPTLGCKSGLLQTGELEQRLKRAPQSDPHLDIPHFVSVQDKALGFHPTLTGLLENSVTFTIGGDSVDHQQQQHHMDSQNPLRKKSLDRNKSAFDLCNHDLGSSPASLEPSSSSSAASGGGLRKASTVANYQLDPRLSPSVGGGLLSSFSSALHLSRNHPEEGGLVMSAKASPFSAAAPASPVPPSSSPPGLAADAAPQGTLNRVKSGMRDIFHSGFFAKPVMCNQEESYRYIMALDR